MDKIFEQGDLLGRDHRLSSRRLRIWVYATRLCVARYHAHMKNKYLSNPMIRRFASNPCGAAAVEFAFVMPVFIGFLFILIETSLLFLNTSMMDIGLESVKKMISTGEINNYLGNEQENKLKERFCEKITAILQCKDVQFDIKSFNNSSSIVMAIPVINGALNTSAFSRDFGSACSIVVVRAYYETFTISVLLRSDIYKTDTIRSIITSSVAFKNEEYAGC